MNHTNGSNKPGMRAYNLQDIVDAVREIELVKTKDWVLITPDGRVFKGSARHVAQALMGSVDIYDLHKDQHETDKHDHNQSEPPFSTRRPDHL